MSDTIQNIFYRDAHGLRVAYPHDSPHHTLISQAREFVRNLLCSEMGMQALGVIANKCEEARSQSYGVSSVESGDLVNRFIDAMRSKAAFPAITVDEIVTDGLGELSKGNVLGADVRLPDFEISINHPRVEQMVNAQQIGATEDLNLYKMQLRCTILHLMGQTFGEYLACSMCSLPPLKMTSHGSSFHTVIEKAGRILETEVLGSYLGWFKDSDRDDPQPGLPFRAELDPDHDHEFIGSWTQVDTVSINQLASNAFVYPLITTGRVIRHGDREGH